MLEEASEPYATQTCIIIQVVLIEGSCQSISDDYGRLSRLSAEGILRGFGNIWQRSRAGEPCDIMVLILGFEQNTPTSGLAWVGGTCSTRSGYGWSIAEPVVIAVVIPVEM